MSDFALRFQKLGMGLLGILLLIVLPWAIAVKMGVRPLVLPSGWQLLNTTQYLLESNILLHSAWVSLVRVNLGFALAVVTAVPLGIILGRSKTLFIAFEPMVESFRFVIPFSWIPIAILWFGTAEIGKLFIIWYAGFFIMLLPTIEAVHAIDKNLVNAARTLGAGKWTIFWRVAFPAIMPDLIVAMRVAFSVCWISILAAELVASRDGLGYLITDARELLQTDVVIVGMAIIGVIGALYNAIFQWLQKHVAY